MTKPWYKDGLRFSCTQCGKCCTGSPGYVWVDEKEIGEMAAFLQISVKEFVSKYTRQAYGRTALLENKRSYDCVFLEDGRKCKVYGARPRQCRTFPWWPENLETPESWKKAAKRCEGIHAEAPVISSEEIEKQLDILTKRHSS
jgi:uncharacterized protein